jgi:hypothetical protein
MVPASPSQSWKQGNLLAQSCGAPRFTADSGEGDTHCRSSFQVRCSSDSEAPSTLDPLPAALCPLTGAGQHYLELDQFIGEDYLVTVHGPISPKVRLEARPWSAGRRRLSQHRRWPGSASG